jgi:F0F1-type ATP synthase membrane subunit a
MVSLYPAKFWDCITSLHIHYNLLSLALRSFNIVIYAVEVFFKYAMNLSLDLRIYGNIFAAH